MKPNALLKDLNTEQVRAVEHGRGPLLVVAGAGTGKTTVVTRRIARLLSGESPLGVLRSNQLLALTFTEKAAGEMEERVTQLMPYGYLDLWISTFHAFCERILHEHGLDIGVPTNFRVITQTEAWLLVRRHLDRFSLNYYRPLGNPTRFIHALLTHFSRAKDEGVTPEQYQEFAQTRLLDGDTAGGAPPDEASEIDRLREIAQSYQEYEQLLLENAMLDFGDLLIYTKRLFETRPHILEGYRKQFRAVLIDEFQDTNTIQYEIIKMIASPDNNLTVVADDDQAIYRWRGASFNNVLQLKKDFPDCVDVVLTTNYRSRQEILDSAHAFIQLNNPNRLEWQLQSGRTALSSPLSKKLISTQKGSAEIAYIHAPTEEQEARLVVQKILSLYKTSKRWSDMAILVRSNAQAESFVRALGVAQVPFQYLAARGLFAKSVVMDACAFLRAIDNYHESASVYRLLRSPIFRISDLDISTLMTEARKKNWSLYEVLKHHATILTLEAETHGVLEHIGTLLERGGASARTQSAKRILYDFLLESGYLKWLTAEQTLERLESLNQLRQFYSWIERVEQSQFDTTVHSVVELINQSLESGDEGELEGIDELSSPDAVKIMTIHAAKGLEFPFVFIVGLVDRRFPTIERKDPVELPVQLMKEILPDGDWHLEEERRLMYVAMTRAKFGLYFTGADSYGGVRKKKPSRFLFELGMISDNAPASSAPEDSETAAIDTVVAAAPSGAPPSTLLPEKFSYTQLKAFETCPLQYKFAHILHIPVRGRATFSFGKSLHKALELFYRRVQELNHQEQGALFSYTQGAHHNELRIPSLDDLLRIYEESWLSEWYDSKLHEQEYYENGKRILKEYYALQDGKWTVPLHLEQPFVLNMEALRFKGVIDRVDPAQHSLGDGVAVEIIDYKTGNVPKTDSQIDRKQLMIYQLAAQEVLSETPVMLSYYYLDAQKKISFLATPRELEQVREELLKTVEQIRASDFPATPDPMVCRFCDFNQICEFRRM